MQRQKFRIGMKSVAMVIAGVLVFSISMIIYSYRAEQNNVRASDQYIHMFNAVRSNDHISATNYALQLIKQHKKSPYARLAGLLLAKLAFEENNVELSRERLLWVINNSVDDDLIKPVAIARLAQLQINNKEYDQAIALIEKENFGKHFSVILENLKGDALLARGDREAAINAYQVVAKNASKDINLDWLFEKLNELGVEKNVAEAKDKDTKDN